MKIFLLINMIMPLLAFSYLLSEKMSCSAELSMKKMFYNLGARSASVYKSILIICFHGKYL